MCGVRIVGCALGHRAGALGRFTARLEERYGRQVVRRRLRRKTFNVTERLIDGLLAEIKPKLATLDASSSEYGRKTSTAFFLAKAFKTYRAINLLVERQYHQDAAVLARAV